MKASLVVAFIVSNIHEVAVDRDPCVVAAVIPGGLGLNHANFTGSWALPCGSFGFI